MVERNNVQISIINKWISSFAHWENKIITCVNNQIKPPSIIYFILNRKNLIIVLITRKNHFLYDIMIETGICRTALWELYYSIRMFTWNKNQLEGTAKEIVGALRHVRGIQDEKMKSLIFLYPFYSLFYHLDFWNVQANRAIFRR